MVIITTRTYYIIYVINSSVTCTLTICNVIQILQLNSFRNYIIYIFSTNCFPMILN